MMADFDSTSLSLAEPEAPEVSTQIDGGRTDPGNNEHRPPTDEDKDDKSKPESRLDAIKRAAEDVEKASKPEDAEKPEKQGEDDKGDDGAEVDQDAEKPEAKEEKAKPKPRAVPLKDMTEDERRAALERMPADQRRKYELNQTPAPERLIPAAKELWGNVPGEVKGEIARIIREHDTEVSQAREFITPLVKYHQMAQQTGTTLHEALDRYVNMEQALRHDPAQGFKALLDNMEMGPEQAIGQILRAFNVDPRALAQHISQSPEAYVAQAPRPQQQPPEDPRIAQYEQRLREQEAQHLRQTVVEPFMATHPRYTELQGDIAFFLQSDRIPASLSPHERLEVAYDMAARINPASMAPAPEQHEALAPSSTRAVAQDLGGNKSVRGAPSSGVDTSTRGKRRMSRGEAIEAAMAELGVT